MNNLVPRVLSPLNLVARVLSPLNLFPRVLSPLNRFPRVLSPLNLVPRVLSPLRTQESSPVLLHETIGDGNFVVFLGPKDKVFGLVDGGK